MQIQTITNPSGRLAIFGPCPGSLRRRARVTVDGKITFKRGDPSGLHSTFMNVGTSMLARTPHGQKVIAARRAKNKVARASRRANR